MPLARNTALLFTLLAGTALGIVTAHAQDQSSEELLQPKNQNSQSSDQNIQSTEGAQGQMNAPGSDEELQQGNQAQDNATSGEKTQDQATGDQDELLRKKQKDTTAGREQQQDQGQQQEDQAGSREQKNLKANEKAAAKKQDQNRENASEDQSKQNKNTAEGKKLKNDKDTEQSSSNKVSKETTGSVEISAKQKTTIRETIMKTHVKPADINIKISVGVTVPRKVKVYPLPPEIVEIVPAYRHYVYFVLADGRIVIVDPDTYEVVYVIVA